MTLSTEVNIGRFCQQILTEPSKAGKIAPFRYYILALTTATAIYANSVT